jgi:hypothetical protein
MKTLLPASTALALVAAANLTDRLFQPCPGKRGSAPAVCVCRAQG